MSKPFLFNYAKFYNYYTDLSNPNIYTDDKELPKIHYFSSAEETNPTIYEVSTVSNRYITINGVNIYVTKYDKPDKNNSIINNKTKLLYKPRPTPVKNPKELVFTIPTKIGEKYYDFHYHFGIRKQTTNIKVDDWKFIQGNNINTRHRTINSRNTRKIYKSTKNIIHPELPYLDKLSEPEKYKIDTRKNIVFFHKTEQNVTDILNDIGYKKHKDCSFRDNTEIRRVEQIICNNKSGKLMLNDFTKDELEQIKTIITLPFIDEKNGGRIKRKYTQYLTRKRYNKKIV
jgi:hypothetical protein